MPTETYDEWLKNEWLKARHFASETQSEGDWHPSYREYWTALPVDRFVVEESELDAYFQNLNATLWGRAWDMSQPESVEGAKRWLMGVLTALGIEVEK